MKPSHRKYVKEGDGKHRGGHFAKKVKPQPSGKPKRNTKLIVAEEVGSKGKGVY